MKLDYINQEKYDLDNVTCYRTFGSELQGRNVRFASDCKHSPWVSDNEYEVFEIPKKTNHSTIRSEGTFLVLARNISFGYWIAGALTVKIDEKSILERGRFYEKAQFTPYGLYEISGADTGELIIYKKFSREYIDCGYPLPHKFPNRFDSLNARKQAYKLSESKIILRLRGHNVNSHYISDKKAVEIYKKKRKK